MRLLLFFILTFNAYAGLIQIEKKGEEVFLISKSCQLNNSQSTSFIRLSQSNLGLPTCQCSNGVCKSNISNIIPSIYKELLYNHTKYEGPNCWNAALLGAGSISSIRYVDDGELKEVLGSTICKKINKQQELKPGDIITIKKRTSNSNRVQELHGFTYLTEQGSFNKDNGDVSKPYVLASVKSIFEEYNITKDCHLNNRCQLFTEAHRCQNISSILEKSEDHKAKEVYEEALKISCTINELFLGNQILSGELTSLLKVNLNILKEMALELETSEFKSILDYQIDSLEKSLFDILEFEEAFSRSGEIVDFSDTDNNLFRPINYDQSGSKLNFDNYIDEVNEIVLSGKANEFLVCEYFSFIKKYNLRISSNDQIIINSDKKLSKLFNECN